MSLSPVTAYYKLATLGSMSPAKTRRQDQGRTEFTVKTTEASFILSHHHSRLSSAL